MRVTNSNTLSIGPAIDAVSQNCDRPEWSVMIPTFNCASYLRQTLESVLSQDIGPEQMQIEVVDDCSTKDDPEEVVRTVGNGRVAFYRKSANGGATSTFNTCIQRSRGHLVHILHGDDYVLPGFYQHLTDLALKHPDASLIATRSFIVDEQSVITGLTPRVAELERGGRSVEPFLRGTPLQCAGVVVRRAFYERNGGFLPSLVHTADWEMWTRAISRGAGVISPAVLACYRMFAANDTGRLKRTAENLRDYLRFYEVLADRYPSLDRNWAMNFVRVLGLQQAMRFSKAGDAEAYQANLAFWREITPMPRRLRSYIGQIVKRAIN